ncbi:MAG: hypothetical protein J0H69_19455 [Burkholderiales bacterium]|nr:hypothetical protein [Burkholderiales bacterium]
MPNTVTFIEERKVGHWHLKFSHMNDFDGAPLGVLCELSKDSQTFGRLSGSASGGDARAIERLFTRAEEWIREYQERKHSGHAGLGDL